MYPEPHLTKCSPSIKMGLRSTRTHIFQGQLLLQEQLAFVQVLRSLYFLRD